jgi:hypothetical protein
VPNGRPSARARRGGCQPEDMPARRDRASGYRDGGARTALAAELKEGGPCLRQADARGVPARAPRRCRGPRPMHRRLLRVRAGLQRTGRPTAAPAPMAAAAARGRARSCSRRSPEQRATGRPSAPCRRST